MADVFLSYSREDAITAKRFADALQHEGFHVWWDQTLHSGEPYDRVTEQALKEAKAVVVLWSAVSVNSRWVRAEATMADRHGTFLPVMIGECERPLLFELTQASELMHWKGNRHDPAWRVFVDDVRRLVDHGPAITRDVPVAAANHFARRRPRLWFAMLTGLVLLGGAIWFASPRIRQAVQDSSAARQQHISIAVLPLVDMTAQGNDEALADGISEEISNWLAQIPGISVVARTSSFMFRGANRDVRQVAQQLNATHVVEGSLRRGEDMVRVTIQLISAADGFHLWAQSFNLEETNALRIEDSVSRAVAQSLDAQLTHETERRWRARQTAVPQAYDLYLQGRIEMRRLTAEHNLRAIDLFQQAIALDPDFPLAHVSQAVAIIDSVSLRDNPLHVVAPQVMALLDRADALSPDLPESIAARGVLMMLQYRLDEAAALYGKALALNPNDADTHRRLGNLHLSRAQPRQAEAQFALAARLDPLHFFTRVRHCLSLQDLTEYAAAEDACRRARELDGENYWGALATSYLEYGRGKYADSLHWLDRALAIEPEDPGMLAQRVTTLLELGLNDEAARTLARIPPADPQRDFMQASTALARQDQVALAAALARLERRSGEFGIGELLDLARLQLIAGRAPQEARSSLERARRLPDWQDADQVGTDAFRVGFSRAPLIAQIELSAGNHESAMKELDALDAALDAYERDGGACAGLYALRALSLALRGDADSAVSNLRKAQEKGWRESLTPRSEPYLRSLRTRQDFQEVLAKNDRELRLEAAAVLAAVH